MKGLLLKEFYLLKSQWMYILFVTVVFSLSFAGKGDGTLAAMFSFISTVLMLNSLAQDEVDQWNQTALTMPLTCRQILLSKYLFALFLCFFGTVLGLLLTLVCRMTGLGDGGMSWEVVVLGAMVSSIVILMIISLMVPLNLKFGVQKSRFVLLGFVGIPVLLGIMADAAGFEVPDMMYFSGSFVWVSLLAALLVLLLFLLSFWGSLRILEKKEY